jgi:hypothetical protein
VVRGPARLVAIVVLPLILGKVLQLFLGSPPGRKLVESAGMGELGTEEGVDMATKYASAGAAAVSAAVTALGNKTQLAAGAVPNPKTLMTAAVAQDTAELLLATGALVKVVGDFLKEREELRIRKLGGALR